MGMAKGKEKVEKEKYAYFAESAMIEYYTKRNCSLRQVGDVLDDKGYAIALPKGECEAKFIGLFIIACTVDTKVVEMS